MKHLRMILAALGALLIVYALSFGPVFSHVVRHPGENPNLAMNLYTPLLRVCGHSKVFNWYVGLWLQK